ncbi:Spore protein SP21 [Acaryochloris thomasi RCC1774]|uniref:Spore protein SP21 n=1 Tax=Acaryochloris thomasi RCC1774 TaxID=1764569 RepID=A0A2W1K503_9CYAN|nr:Hsp20/alpha crystallin family protein [Acaryochloris thomasi]PZD74847.1 Spore protein SP21 [Acaryochloris thomasi RCC1774]
MTLVHWTPWQEIDTIERRLNRLFDQDISPSLRGFSVPAAEFSQDEEAVYLNLEAPGIDINDLDIQVTEKAVSISGERKSETSSETQGKIRSEFNYGKFQRVVPLPARVDNTQVKAEYKDGIVHLTLPKAEAEKNKVVKVEIASTTA